MRPTTERRPQIVGAALAILREKGAGGLTARAVAARAGLALGQVSYHFRSMEELLIETHRAATADLAAVTAAYMQRTPDDPTSRLAAFLRGGLADHVLSDDYLNLRVELWAAARHHPALADTEREIYDRYRAQLGRLLADFGVVDVVPVSNAIIAILDGLWLDWLRRGDTRAVEHVLDACMTLAKSARKREDGQGT
jgi:TetR/AcrR family transcriptional regulator, transcriptional repressor of bet genes